MTVKWFCVFVDNIHTAMGMECGTWINENCLKVFHYQYCSNSYFTWMIGWSLAKIIFSNACWESSIYITLNCLKSRIVSIYFPDVVIVLTAQTVAIHWQQELLVMLCLTQRIPTSLLLRRCIIWHVDSADGRHEMQAFLINLLVNYQLYYVLCHDYIHSNVLWIRWDVNKNHFVTWRVIPLKNSP